MFRWFGLLLLVLLGVEIYRRDWTMLASNDVVSDPDKPYQSIDSITETVVSLSPLISESSVVNLIHKRDTNSSLTSFGSVGAFSFVASPSAAQESSEIANTFSETVDDFSSTDFEPSSTVNFVDSSAITSLTTSDTPTTSSQSSTSSRSSTPSSASITSTSGVSTSRTTYSSVDNGRTVIVTRTSLVAEPSGSSSATTNRNTDSSNGLSKTNRIVVGVVVGVGGSLLIGVIALFFFVKRRSQSNQENGSWTFWRKNEKSNEEFLNGELGVRDRNINQGSNF